MAALDQSSLDFYYFARKFEASEIVFYEFPGDRRHLIEVSGGFWPFFPMPTWKNHNYTQTLKWLYLEIAKLNFSIV